MIHEEICTYEVCKLAKEKGFNIHCVPFYALEDFTAEYIDDIGEFYEVDFEKGYLYLNYPIKGLLHKEKMLPAPTQSLLQRWLREEKNIVVEVGYYSVEQKYYWRVYDTSKCDVFASFIPPSKSMSRYNTWEQALESGLKYGLKKLEQQ